MPWRQYWSGVLQDLLEGVAKGMISLATIELLLEMQEQNVSSYHQKPL